METLTLQCTQYLEYPRGRSKSGRREYKENNSYASIAVPWETLKSFLIYIVFGIFSLTSLFLNI